MSPRAPSLGRRMVLAMLAMAIGFGGALLILEVVARVLPVGQGLRARSVTSVDPVFRFEPNRDVTYSLGWKMAHAQPVHVNNAGFVSDQDYNTTDSTPLLALIGDSYVEAQIVPPSERLVARLAQAGAGGRVYGFAASGAPLSQYAIWAEHASKVYGASGGVFVVVGNDFDESLASEASVPGFHYFAEQRGQLGLELRPFEPNRLRAVADYSAFARYLVFNLYLPQRVATLLSLVSGPANSPAPTGSVNPGSAPQEIEDMPPFVGNTASSASPARLRESERAVAAFLDEIVRRTGWSPDRVLLVVDGFRLYDARQTAAAPRSYFGLMRTYLMQTAAARGYEVIDLEPIFATRHAQDGTRFEHDDDAHWNGVAHGLAAEAIMRSKLFQTFLRSRVVG